MGRKSHWISWVIGAVIVFSFVFAIVRQNNNDTLSVYTDTDRVETEEGAGEEEEEEEIVLEYYTDPERGFTIGVPEGWTQVNQDNGVMFVDSASVSSIQVEVGSYDPSVNNASAETLAAGVADEGMTYTNFQWVTDTHYELMYQDLDDQTYDYIEEVYFDRDSVVTLTCVFNDANYSTLIPYYEEMINTFSWTQTDPVPEGYFLYYNESLQFETGVPSSWTMSYTDTSVAAMDGDTGASMTITVQQTGLYLDDVSATEMSSFLGSGTSGFIMSSYEHDSTSAVVTTSYIQDNIQYQNPYYIFSDGEYWYIIAFDYEEGTLADETLPETCAGLFRSFRDTGQEETTD